METLFIICRILIVSPENYLLMSSYFTLISHHESQRRHDFYNNIQRPSGMLSIGWGEINPIGSTEARIARQIGEEYNPATLNITNGVASLKSFSNLKLGDIVFIRGNATILDIAIVTGPAGYFYGEGHDGPDDYCTKINFVPLLGNTRFQLQVDQIPQGHHGEFVYDQGRSRTMKEISEDLAVTLMRLITSRV
jgi:hypothetical protein